MKLTMKRLSVLLIGWLLIMLVFPPGAFAAGKIDTERPTTLILSYRDGEKPIPHARFSVYRVADMDAYGYTKLTGDFKPYRNSIEGLAKPEKLTQEQWIDMIPTLRAYVLRDRIAPAAEGMTDENGRLEIPELPVGLYLILGNRATTDDFYTYTSSPFMLLLPGRNSARNDWDYEVTAEPKFSKDFNPPDEEDDYITRKVLKKWDDEGYETIRPEQVSVQLLRDGEVFDTQVLNAMNNWRYAWDHLDSDYEWLVVEEEPEHYAINIEQIGITFMVSNKYVVPVVENDPPVLKRITGDKPKEDSIFTFVMTAQDSANPMPEGSGENGKEIHISGAGYAEFGAITFTDPGNYVYEVSEKNGGIQGYTYDKSVYTVTFEVKQEEGELNCTYMIRNAEGENTDALEFTNHYKTPGGKLPQTGMLWWPVPILMAAGLLCVTIGVVRRRRCE